MGWVFNKKRWGGAGEGEKEDSDEKQTKKQKDGQEAKDKQRHTKARRRENEKQKNDHNIIQLEDVLERVANHKELSKGSDRPPHQVFLELQLEEQGAGACYGYEEQTEHELKGSYLDDAHAGTSSRVPSRANDNSRCEVAGL